ncbi:hypothetical protein LIS90_13965, partial [Flavobacterium psychrophilum]|uniref:hypothetical protein n=1 Tax=Flavobacterium psychrophilum TaxID=96345 RepID=UPI001D063D14
ISNREVKPACADGTAFMWESMSSPFFKETLSKSDRVSLKKPYPNRIGFFVYKILVKRIKSKTDQS